MDKKTLALIQGDPAGIGPELLVKLLVDPAIREAANLIVVGDPRILARGEQQVGLDIPNLRQIDAEDPLKITEGEVLHLNIAIDGMAVAPMNAASAAGGAASIKGLKKALELSRDGNIDGIVFMPFNKESMHLGGNNFSDELGYASDFFKLTTRASEFNVANGMWNGRVTSHVAMKDVPSLLTTDRIEQSIKLTDHTLKMAGYKRPRIVVAAYNPHAGDGGLMGDEEDRVIRPAVLRAKAQQIAVEGPLPADTLWLKMRDGVYDAAVTMYHDQGQIAIKLLAFDKGVSVLAGLPIPITTPAHGTAFDIAGQNKANVVPSANAVRMCLNMASHKNATDGIL
jgi:4-hydroxythreonine-4-phosphate dehydrogenase